MKVIESKPLIHLPPCMTRYDTLRYQVFDLVSYTSKNKIEAFFNSINVFFELVIFMANKIILFIDNKH